MIEHSSDFCRNGPRESYALPGTGRVPPIPKLQLPSVPSDDCGRHHFLYGTDGTGDAFACLLTFWEATSSTSDGGMLYWEPLKIPEDIE